MIRCSDRCTDGCVCGAVEMNDEIRPFEREKLLDLLAEAARTLRLGLLAVPSITDRLVNDIEEAVNRG